MSILVEQNENSADGTEESDESLDDLDRFVASRETSSIFTTKYVLSCFGRERRGSVVNRAIQDWLHAKKLEMIPSISEADYYGQVEIRLIGETADSSAESGNTARSTTSSLPTPSGTDSWVLSSLKDDAEELDILEYGASVEDAISRMKDNNRNKLPLFFSDSDRSSLIGTVTLADLSFEQTDKDSKLVEKAVKQVPVVSTNENCLTGFPQFYLMVSFMEKPRAGKLCKFIQHSMSLST